MPILFFDTETTGFYKKQLPAGHDDQPYIVQLAAELCADDGKTLGVVSAIINNSVEIPKEASDVHGITAEIASKYGVPVEIALTSFAHFYFIADLLVAHNMAFDKPVVETAFARRYGRDKPFSKPVFCTMTAAAPVVNIPPTAKMLAAGFDKPKSPKLEECVSHFFGETLEGAHDALVDVRACKRVYFELKRREAEKAAEA